MALTKSLSAPVALLALLENLQGEVPDVLRPYGAPARVER